MTFNKVAAGEIDIPVSTLPVPECLARIVRADLLLRSPNEHQIADGWQELAQSRLLMQETGAMLFKRFITELDVDSHSARRIPNDRTALS
jgi:adenylate cyclase